MNRMFVMIMLVVVTILMFHFTGILGDQSTFVGSTLTMLKAGDTSQIPTSTFWIWIIAIGGIALGGAIYIGYFTGATLDTVLASSIGIFLAGAFVSLAADIMIIFNYLKDINLMLGVMICSPLYIAWGLSLYDWFRGRD